MARDNDLPSMANGTDGIRQPIDTSLESFLGRTYDYIICGGGTAGLCIAARLSEDPSVMVGVIEAGRNRLDDPIIDIPAMFPQTLGNPDYDYVFMTTPQVGNRNKVQHMPRGKVLGGSSGINYMMYVRGSESDYDDWAELTGDDGWSSKNMKQYMRKHQTLEPFPQSVMDRTSTPFVDVNHGHDGPIHTSFNDGKFPIEDAVVAAGDYALNFVKKPTDPWSGDHIGFFNTMGTVSNTGHNKGKRSYAARDYFEPNATRPNLRVITEAIVARIVLEGNPATATAVEFMHHGQLYTIQINREVIVCGGTINSPQILELSGIGDPNVLQAAGVECKVDLPSVGNDLQDHVLTFITHELAPGEFSADSLFKKPEMMETGQKTYAETSGGPMSWVSSTQGFFSIVPFLEDGEMDDIINSIRAMPHKTEFHRIQREQVIRQIQDPKSANLQFVLICATANTVNGQQDQSRFFPPAEDKTCPDGITFAINLEYPAARGQVHIKSKDPFEHPELDPGYLAADADIAVLAAAYKFVDRMVEAPALKSRLGKRLYPGPKWDLTKLADRREAVQDFNAGTYHACGSCAMGSTLDSRLKVKGVKNIRVADASVFPNNISGNIVSSTYMVAERAADIIKEDWKSRL